jgi:dTDP-4-dehydrorhamnose 3,5-epimerase
MNVTLDDMTFAHVYIPPGILHGFQALTDQTDVCYRIDREHTPGEDLSVRFDDPDLGIEWPLPVDVISARDMAAGSWADLVTHLAELDAKPARTTASGS